MARITFIAGPHSGEEWELPDADVVVGRGSDTDLTVLDPSVSTRHIKLQRRDDDWFVVDLGSSNGTEVNAARADYVQLNDNDSVAIGDTIFLFRSASGDALPLPAETVVEAPAEMEATVVARPKAETDIQAPPPAPSEPRPAPPRIEPKAPAFVPPPVPLEATADQLQLVEQMKEKTDAIRAEVGKVIVGQIDVLDQVLMCVVARGHALLIGLPGMAKTLMVQTIASVLDMNFKRIQFTPDLMPMDIIGTDVLETDQDTGEKSFRFIQGPIFCNMLLADEINRTPPKTQAALLEAMQEKKVTAGNETFLLDQPFLVLATQNPIEQEGTYPLPEAQLDRFMFNIWVDYPDEAEEEAIVGYTTSGEKPQPNCILTKEEVLLLQETVSKIPVSQHVIKYAIRLVRATRPAYETAPEITRKFVSVGAGPRAGQNLVLAAKAMAVLEGRIHVSCNDIRRAAIPVLRHRILTNFAADSEGLTTMDVVTKLLEEVQEPGEEAYAAQA